MEEALILAINSPQQGRRRVIVEIAQGLSDKHVAPSATVPFLIDRFCQKCTGRVDLWDVDRMYDLLDRMEKGAARAQHERNLADACEFLALCSADNPHAGFFDPSPQERKERIQTVSAISADAKDAVPDPCVVRLFRDGLMPSCVPLLQTVIDRCVTGKGRDGLVRCIVWYIADAKTRQLFVDARRSGSDLKDGYDVLWRVALDVAQHPRVESSVLLYVVRCKDIFYHRLNAARKHRVARTLLLWDAFRALLGELTHQEKDLPRQNILTAAEVDPLFAFTYRRTPDAKPPMNKDESIRSLRV